jgi:hypothetical protein
MTIDAVTREQVRSRANFACEFCGVSETDVGGELTIDHYQPQAKGGLDHPDNLIYACSRCNQYKLDYWPANTNAPQLWNPRCEQASQHFLQDEDGTLRALTQMGSFTIARLRLNRAPLVAHRLRKLQSEGLIRLLARHKAVLDAIELMLTQQTDMLNEQRNLLREQQELLRILRQSK